MKPFLIGDIIKTSYEMFKKHWGILWGVLAVVFVVNIAFSIAGTLTEDQWALSLVVVIISVVVSVLLQLGIIRIILNLVDGKPAELGQLSGESDKLWRFLGASIIYGLIVLGGFILLIVPGIIWSIKYGQYKMFIVDKNMGVMESIRESGKLTYGAKSKLFLLGLAFAGLFILALIPLLLGLIVMIPMATIAPAIVFRKLLAVQAGATPDATADAPAGTPQPFVPLDGPAETNTAQPEASNPAPKTEEQKENQ